jgi:peroxiredoxin
VVLVLWANLANGQNAASVPPLDRLVGSKVANFSRTDAVSGKPVALSDLSDRKAVVLVFTGTECPIGNLLMPRLVALQEQYGPQGVSILAIDANASETAEAVAAHAREYHVAFPVLLDPGGTLADALQARLTCEVLLLDSDRVIRYRGAVDDQYGYGVRKERSVHSYLTDALDSVLAGQPVETPASTVAGCPIERSVEARKPLARIQPAAPEVIEAYEALEAEVDPDSIGPVDYSGHVASLVREKCQGCHRPGQVAPFSLLTYDDARRWGASIAEVVESRRMPPWHADPRYGHFANDRHLTARERATLLAWIDQGTPRGDASQEPPPRAWPDGWTIGTPDVVLEMPDAYTVKPEGVLPYQRFRVKTGFTEDRWAQAIEPRPGDRSVVHHIVVYMLDPADPKESGKGQPEHLAAYAPGDLPTVLPAGVAKRIPAGAELIIELHYTPIGKTRIDRSSIGIVFAKEPPQYRDITMPILNQKFEIPPGAADHEVRSSLTLPTDFRLIGFLPHMHLRGKNFTYTAYPPGEPDKPEVLLAVPRYDFGWQSCYWLREPKLLPKGTLIECLAHFDNSTSNRALTEAQTQQAVRWGQQTWEEMMIGYIDVLVPVPPQQAEPKPAEAATQ